MRQPREWSMGGSLHYVHIFLWQGIRPHAFNGDGELPRHRRQSGGALPPTADARNSYPLHFGNIQELSYRGPIRSFPGHVCPLKIFGFVRRVVPKQSCLSQCDGRIRNNYYLESDCTHDISETIRVQTWDRRSKRCSCSAQCIRDLTLV